MSFGLYLSILGLTAFAVMFALGFIIVLVRIASSPFRTRPNFNIERETQINED
ncbi:MAG: hypothetical protein RL095_479 [Verrucomicrobiota bacterium]|jgi:hypothetical protein